VGEPDWIDDPRLHDRAARSEYYDACVELLEALFATRTLEQWKVVLSQGQGQWDIVQQVGELRQDVQARANGYLQAVDHGDGRTLMLVAAPVQFDEAPARLAPAPRLGEHTAAVLATLGVGKEELAALVGDGTVRG
jgi:crotonobetainyl-CoA:carnitine CoA-transferase CaiB-like acyl-CoA transferase